MSSDSPIKRLDHINITVRGFAESVRWYGGLFGFKVVEEEVTDGVRWGVLRAGDSMLCIYERPDFVHLDRFELADRGLHGMAHFAFRIADCEQWLTRARELGVEILYEGAVRWSNSVSYYVKDPTGYEIEVVCWDNDEVDFEGVLGGD